MSLKRILKSCTFWVYANVLCELSADDVTFISGKSILFYVQCVFKKNVNIFILPFLEIEHLYSWNIKQLAIKQSVHQLLHFCRLKKVKSRAGHVSTFSSRSVNGKFQSLKK